MNTYYAPQNSYYGQPNAYYAQAPQPQYAPMPVAPQNSGSGIKMAAGALGLLAVGIAAFALVLGMNKNSTPENTAAQSAPSTVFNIPSEINIPSLGTTSSPSAPVVVNNPSPRVITIPGQAPVAQAPVREVPVQQQAPVQNPVNGNGDQAKADAQAAADAQAKADAQKKADEEAAAKKKADDEAAATKAANAQKAKDLRASAANLRQQAEQIRISATLQLPGTPARTAMENQAVSLEASATSMEAQAAQLGG
jgi:hypothetical protein